MQAGFFRLNKRHTISRKLNAICCREFGIELIFFTPSDIDMENHKIYGEVFKNNEWINKTVDIPSIVNNTPYFKDYEYIRAYLDSMTHLMFKPFGGKEKEYKRFSRSKSMNEFVIPSQKSLNEEIFLSFIDEYNKVVAKPLYSDKGKGIIYIEKKDNDYFMINDKEETNLTKDGLLSFYNEHIGTKYLLTKYIRSLTVSEHPFDIRLNFEKNDKGKWIRAQNYVRIGMNDKLTSNIDRGGGTIRTNKFLSTNYSESAQKQIKEQIAYVSRKLPFVVEKMVDFEINSIGADFGVDDDNKMYLFEVNSYPGSTNAVGQVAYHRASYMYKFLKEHEKEPVR